MRCINDDELMHAKNEGNSENIRLPKVRQICSSTGFSIDIQVTYFPAKMMAARRHFFFIKWLLIYLRNSNSRCKSKQRSLLFCCRISRRAACELEQLVIHKIKGRYRAVNSHVVGNTLWAKQISWNFHIYPIFT
jgi:hypothetical protein